MKKRTIGSCSILALALAASGVAAAAKNPGVQPSAIEAAQRNQIDKLYAGQDLRLQQVDAELVTKGKYQDAIDIYRTVLMELEEIIGKRNDWRAKQRFDEITKRLRELEFVYGAEILTKAEDAYLKKRYPEAIALAQEAGTVCAALKERAEVLRVNAVYKQRGLEKSANMSGLIGNEKVVPNSKLVKKELAAARTLLANGQYEAARRRVEAVYKINPYNQEAAHIANIIYAKYYTAGYRRHLSDLEGMLAYEAWQWVEPVFYRDRDEKTPDAEGEKVKESDNELQDRLDKHTISHIRFDNNEIAAVIDLIARDSKVRIEFSESRMKKVQENAANGQKQGNNQAQAEDGGENAGENGGENAGNNAGNNDGANTESENVGDRLISLEVNNVSLRELLDYICFLTDLNYVVFPDRIVFGQAAEDIVTETLFISHDALLLIEGSKLNVAEDASALEAPPEEDKADAGAGAGAETEKAGDGELAAGKGRTIEVSPAKLKAFFELYGVKFEHPNSRIVRTPQGDIIMSNTLPNFAKIYEVLRFINTNAPMVQVEVKTIEISEQDWQELGFNWSLGSFASSDSKGGKWTFAPGKNTTYNGVAPIMSLLRAGLSGVDSKLLDNFNIFPNLFGSIRPFGGDQELSLSLTINALDRSDRTETISAPTVTVASGQQAKVVLGRAYYFPDSWDELEIDTDGGSGDSGYSYSITPPTPDFGDSENIGTTLTVTPTVSRDNKLINLQINPKITNFVGEDSWDIVVHITEYRETAPGQREKEEHIETYRVWAPIITTRELNVNVNVYDGETIVLGGLSDSQSQSRLDKIPILGDLPFIGRLFQSQSQTSLRKNILIFVTARLIDAKGLPINLDQKNVGIPDLNR